VLTAQLTDAVATVQCTSIVQSYLMVVWPHGNSLAHISKVTICQAQLVPCVYNHPPRPTRPPALGGMGNEYRPKWSDALWLGNKGRYGSFHFCIKHIFGR